MRTLVDARDRRWLCQETGEETPAGRVVVCSCDTVSVYLELAADWTQRLADEELLTLIHRDPRLSLRSRPSPTRELRPEP
jgi:hypothetical protein